MDKESILTEQYHKKLHTLLEADFGRMCILHAVSALDLPDCWVAAGFVRNLVWDDLHNTHTELNDVDVVYYCQADTQGQLAIDATNQLKKRLPNVNWQVKNQALMHVKRQHKQYVSSADAMTFWPEQETAVGVKIDSAGSMTILAPFGLNSLFEGGITFNPKADKQVFLQRIEQKQWLTIWPNLRLDERHG